MSQMASLGFAAWLGILCAISPCPLATNIAAVGFISRDASPSRTLFGGLLYAVGRAAVYCALAAAVVMGVSAAPELSHLLQKYLNRLMGPLLVLVAVVLLGLVRLPSVGTGRLSAVQQRLASSGVLGALLLGALFALALCPPSAAIYFGSLLPLALERHSPFLVPAVFGIASALPVVVVAVLFAAGMRKIGTMFGRLTTVERHLRIATGIVFLVVGIVLTLKYAVNFGT